VCWQRGPLAAQDLVLQVLQLGSQAVALLHSGCRLGLLLPQRCVPALHERLQAAAVSRLKGWGTCSQFDCLQLALLAAQRTSCALSCCISAAMALMAALLLATWLSCGRITTRPAAVAKCSAARVVSAEPAQQHNTAQGRVVSQGARRQAHAALRGQQQQQQPASPHLLLVRWW
jgi:hypothetical protein